MGFEAGWACFERFDNFSWRSGSGSGFRCLLMAEGSKF